MINYNFPKFFHLSKSLPRKVIFPTLLFLLLMMPHAGFSQETVRHDYQISPWFHDKLDNVQKIKIPDVTTKISRGIEKAKKKATEIEELRSALKSESWESALIDGLSDFIAERAETELVQWFLEEMQGNICLTISEEEERKIKQKKYLFLAPNVVDDRFLNQYFDNLCSLRYQYSKSISTPSLITLVTALRKDLEQLPAVIVQNELKLDWLFYFLNTMERIRDGLPPVNVIAGLAENENLKQTCNGTGEAKSKVECTLYNAGAVAQAYLTAITDEEFIDLETFKNVLKAKNVVKLPAYKAGHLEKQG